VTTKKSKDTSKDQRGYLGTYDPNKPLRIGFKGWRVIQPPPQPRAEQDRVSS
jgi:hypothetical protein